MQKEEIESVIYAIDYTLLVKGCGVDHPDSQTLDVAETTHLQNARAQLIAEYGEEITLRPPFAR